MQHFYSAFWKLQFNGKMIEQYLSGFFCIAGAEKDGRVNFARSVRNIQPVNTAPVSNRGSATAKRAGVDYSVTKVRLNPKQLQ